MPPHGSRKPEVLATICRTHRDEGDERRGKNLELKNSGKEVIKERVFSLLARPPEQDA